MSCSQATLGNGKSQTFVVFESNFAPNMSKSFFSVARALMACAALTLVGGAAHAAPDPTGPASPQNINNLNQLLTKIRPDKMVLVGGDELVPATRIQAFRNRMVAQASGKPYRETMSAFDTHTQYWTATHIVPYVYDNLPASEQNAFEQAAREWEKYINIKFVPRTTEKDYVSVFQDPNAIGYGYSNLGFLGNGKQIISLPTGSTKFLTAHEIGHTLGLDHEHQRSDRDNFITVHYENCKGNEGSYTIISDTDNHRQYDFESIMHYFDTAFSTNGQRTMVCKPGYESHQATMGYQQEITLTDQAGAADIYGFPPGVTATPVPTPTKPPQPTMVCDPVTVKEGAAGETTPMTFHIGLSYVPTKDVSFSYKVVRYILPGESAAAADVDSYSAQPGDDYVEISDGSILLPAATTDNNGNSTRTTDITLSVIGDNNVENDESLMLVLSDPVNVRFPNDENVISIKGTISNDDFNTVATPAPSATAVATPVATSTPTPTTTPRPTATPTPVSAPTARVSLSPTKPSHTDTIVAKVTLTPSTGATSTSVWRLRGTIVARNVSSIDLERYKNVKRGDIVSVEVTPARGKVKGKVVTAQVTVINTPPTANDGELSTLSAVPVSMTLTGNDIDGDALTYSVVTKPRNGTATISSSSGKSTLTYRSKVGFIGAESIGVAASDGHAKSEPATIAVQVKANTSPSVASLTPSSGTVASAKTVTFTQTVKDSESNLDSVSFIIGKSSSGADGVGLVYDASTRTVCMISDDGKELSDPFKVGATMENEHAKVVLRSASTSSGTTTLSWQVTFKSGWAGDKTLWVKAVDQGTLVDGVRSVGKITITDSSTTTTKGTATTDNSAGNS